MHKRTVATYQDAQLILNLYELRREVRLRTAREWFRQEFSPRSLDDIRALAPGTDENAWYRMVTTYWDMAASFVAHGILDADLFLESGGEMLMVWAKLEHLVPDVRSQMNNPRFLSNVEKVVQGSESAEQRLKGLRERFAALRAKPA